MDDNEWVTIYTANTFRPIFVRHQFDIFVWNRCQIDLDWVSLEVTIQIARPSGRHPVDINSPLAHCIVVQSISTRLYRPYWASWTLRWGNVGVLGKRVGGGGGGGGILFKNIFWCSLPMNNSQRTRKLMAGVISSSIFHTKNDFISPGLTYELN